MQANLATAIGHILDDEGGFAQRAGEPGGAVNKGVSFLAFQIWRNAQRKPAPTFADLKALTVEEATAIYTANYAAKIGFNALPAGVDYAALDSAVNEGVAFTNALLTLTHSIDDARSRVQFMSDTRLGLKKLKPGWKSYGHGWTDRIGVNVIARATALASQPKTPALAEHVEAITAAKGQA